MILIANIGNRNLTYAGKPLLNAFEQRPEWQLPEGQFDFRAATAWLLDHYEQEKDHLDGQIFTRFLDVGPGERLSRIYLIASDQADPRHRHQDTLHSAELLRRVLRDKLGAHPADVLVYRQNPAHEADLFADLAPRLRDVLARHAPEPVRFVDAGGTSQMKSVVKELLRYYVLPPQRLEVKYINSFQEASDVNSPLHDKYILLRTARAFVENYDYAGALAVLRQVEVAVSPQLKALIAVANCRKGLDLNGAQTAVKTLDVMTLPFVFQQYLTESIPASAIPFTDDFTLPESRFDVFEIAALCELHLFRRRDLPLGVLTFIRLCEEMGQNFAEERGVLPGPADKRSEYTKQTVFLANTDQWLNNQTSFKTLTRNYGVPYLIAYLADRCKSDALGSLLFKTAVATLQYINPKGKSDIGINLIRNLTFLTHRNEAVTPDRIKHYAPGFLDTPNGPARQLLTGLGLPARSVYDQMNDELLLLFQQE